jgi:hypoxanthine phosphoribosyltransferase
MPSRRPRGAGPDPVTGAATATTPRFAHASEAELSRILDYYGIRWEYEPRVFPIRWNADGSVIESFAPDFYLPDLDLYLELTTLKQSLVRRKNRKLRYLRELYPMIRIKLFYARDFRALLLKYGRMDAAASLIGSDGQAVPEPAVGMLVGTTSAEREAEVVGAAARPGA